ncbi:MAG: helix-turn-helix transcriptional regulator [Erysipelotrichales bacterium]|nr:helix-turn-helix transcriptional regulator [Erysipelotrichales bacterium]
MLGEKIRQIRENSNYTKSQFAEQVGIDRKTLIRWENDESVPSIEQVNRIIEITGANAEDFIQISGGEGKDEETEAKSVTELQIEELKKEIVQIKHRNNTLEVAAISLLLVLSCITEHLPVYSFMRITIGLIPSLTAMYLSFRNKYPLWMKLITVLLVCINFGFSVYHLYMWFKYYSQVVPYS